MSWSPGGEWAGGEWSGVYKQGWATVSGPAFPLLLETGIDLLLENDVELLLEQC